MFNVKVITAWVGTGVEDDSYFPSIARDYQVAAEDITGGVTLPDPNLTTWQIICDQATLVLIEADPNYNVLSSEEIINNV